MIRENENAFVSVTLNPDNIQDLTTFEKRRKEAISAQQNGEDPQFEALLTTTGYEGTDPNGDGPRHAYDVVTLKWLAAIEHMADDPTRKQPPSIGRNCVRYTVIITDTGGISTIQREQDYGSPSPGRVAATQAAQRNMRTGVTEINTPKYIKPFRTH